MGRNLPCSRRQEQIVLADRFDCFVASSWLTCAGPGGTRDGREIMTGKRARHRPRDIGRKPALALAQRGKLGGFERAKRARVAVLGGRVAQTPTSKRGTKRRTKRRKKRRKKEGKESVGVGGVVWRRFRTSTEEINETGLARERRAQRARLIAARGGRGKTPRATRHGCPGRRSEGRSGREASRSCGRIFA